MPLNEELAKHFPEQFQEFDFLFMMFILVSGMTAAMSLVKLALPDHSIAQTNYCMYLSLLTLGLVLQSLCRDLFSFKWNRFQPETKVQLLFGMKSFVAVWVILNYSTLPAVMGLDVDSAHQQMNLRVNTVIALNQSRSVHAIPAEVTYFLLAITAATLSCAIVKININFGYYFFVMTRAFQQ